MAGLLQKGFLNHAQTGRNCHTPVFLVTFIRVCVSIPEALNN